MLKKVLKLFAIVLCVGFISAFVRGYNYHTSNPKEKIYEEVYTTTETQEMIDEDTIKAILNKY